MAQGNLSGITKKIIMLAFLVGGLSIAITGILGAIYVRNYPFHSDPCDFPVGELTETQTTCESQITTRGYKDTTDLIKQSLLPKDFALLTAKTTASGDCTTHAADEPKCKAAPECVWDATATACKDLDEANLCVWVGGTTNKCRETSGTSNECSDARNDDGTLKDRNGPNDKCLQTRVPEICKQTGFRQATDSGETQSVLEKLADAGHNVEVAFAMFIVVSVLGCLSLINIMFRFEYGYISGLTIICDKMTDIGIFKAVLCAKKNNVDIDEDDGRFHNDHEAYSIWVVLLIHEALLIVFGRMAIDAQELIQKECYEVTGAPYAVGPPKQTALDFIKLSDDKDAFKFEQQGNSFYTAFVIFWWITVISAAVKALGMFMAVEKSSDMDIAIPLAIEILPAMCGGKKESAGSFGMGGGGNMGRRVQLRGQF